MSEISISNGSNYIIITKPEVTNPKFLVLSSGGVEVGHISATFDFSKMPPRYHALAFDLCSKFGGSHRINFLEVISDPDHPRSIAARKLKEDFEAHLKRPWWKKLLGI